MITLLPSLNTAVAPVQGEPGEALGENAAGTGLNFVAFLDEQLQTLVPVTEDPAAIAPEEDKAAPEAAAETTGLWLPEMPASTPTAPIAAAIPAAVAQATQASLAQIDTPIAPADKDDVERAVTAEKPSRGASSPLPGTEVPKMDIAAAKDNAASYASAFAGIATAEVAPTAPAAGTTGQPTPAAPANAPQVTLTQPVGTERWNAELGQNITLLVRAEQMSASLHVTPADMGPIEIRIDMKGDEASLSFNVQQSDTRSAVENALPRLREMLAEAGISLGQTHVQQQQTADRENAMAAQGQSRGESAAGEAETQVIVRTRIGLVDTFA